LVLCQKYCKMHGQQNVKSKSSVAVACFLPGRAKDLSAHPYIKEKILVFQHWDFKRLPLLIPIHSLRVEQIMKCSVRIVDIPSLLCSSPTAHSISLYYVLDVCALPSRSDNVLMEYI
jgi:hypothetical protein